MAITNKKISQKRERQIADDLGGRAHAGSGNQWHTKGDASNDKFLIEDKFTHKDKYTLKYATLDKLETEAFKINKIPIFKVGFPKTKDDYVLIPWEYIHIPDEVEWIMEHLYTYKKSLILHQDLLKKWYSNYPKEIFALIEFKMNSRRYYVMEYQTFVDNEDFFD